MRIFIYVFILMSFNFNILHCQKQLDLSDIIYTSKIGSKEGFKHFISFDTTKKWIVIDTLYHNKDVEEFILLINNIEEKVEKNKCYIPTGLFEKKIKFDSNFDLNCISLNDFINFKVNKDENYLIHILNPIFCPNSNTYYTTLFVRRHLNHKGFHLFVIFQLKNNEIEIKETTYGSLQ